MPGITAGLLEQGLAAAALRQRIIAHNLANADTPGFRRSQVAFETLLQQVLATGANPRSVAPRLERDVLSQGRADGNNVDLEREMTLLATNQLWQGALVRQVSDHFARLRIAIEGRR